VLSLSDDDITVLADTEIARVRDLIHRRNRDVGIRLDESDITPLSGPALIDFLNSGGFRVASNLSKSRFVAPGRGIVSFEEASKLKLPAAQLGPAKDILSLLKGEEAISAVPNIGVSTGLISELTSAGFDFKSGRFRKGNKFAKPPERFGSTKSVINTIRSDDELLRVARERGFKYALGGMIFGPGGPKSDRVPIL